MTSSSVMQPAAPAPASAPPRPAPARPRPRIDWATLHRRTFGTDVLRCPCGGRRSVTALHSTRKAAEERLTELGLPPRSLLLPQPTTPPQLHLDV